LSDRIKVDVRAEYLNVFNHPMFGLPGSQCAPDDQWAYGSGAINSDFGKECFPQRTLDEGGGSGGSGQSALYAPGGPRSAQFTQKVMF
jgi:hypothetical protein